MKPSPARLGRHGLPRCLVQPIQECCCKGVHPPAEWSRQRDGTREQLDRGNMKSMGFQQVMVHLSRRKKPWIPGCSIDSVVRKCLLEGRRTVARLPAPPPNQSTTITERHRTLTTTGAASESRAALRWRTPHQSALPEAPSPSNGVHPPAVRGAHAAVSPPQSQHPDQPPIRCSHRLQCGE